MIYRDAEDWRSADAKRLMLFGMSGLGKTYISSMLRETAGWFHYSVDYRIGTRYMGEHIADNAKAEAMKVPFLAELLKSDSIYIGSNITFENLDPLSSYLGKPGNPKLGGLTFKEYQRRQDLHRSSEISATLDAAHFIQRAKRIYGYDNFICDTSGSICEVIDTANPEDDVMQVISSVLLPVWIKGSEDHTAELVRRFDKAPKPMYYQPQFLLSAWKTYLKENGILEKEVDPNAFIRWTYARALAHRQPRYQAMAEQWGVTVEAEDVARVTSEADMVDLVADALAAR